MYSFFIDLKVSRQQVALIFLACCVIFKILKFNYYFKAMNFKESEDFQRCHVVVTLKFELHENSSKNWKYIALSSKNTGLKCIGNYPQKWTQSCEFEKSSSPGSMRWDQSTSKTEHFFSTPLLGMQKAIR